MSNVANQAMNSKTCFTNIYCYFSNLFVCCRRTNPIQKYKRRNGKYANLKDFINVRGNSVFMSITVYSFTSIKFLNSCLLCIRGYNSIFSSSQMLMLD
jgi:hypothetical protein